LALHRPGVTSVAEQGGTSTGSISFGAFVVDDYTSTPAKMGSEKMPLREIEPVLVPPCSATDVTPGLCFSDPIFAGVLV
jgi:hypothetical protein